MTYVRFKSQRPGKPDTLWIGDDLAAILQEAARSARMASGTTSMEHYGIPEELDPVDAARFPIRGVGGYRAAYHEGRFKAALVGKL